MLMDVYVSHLEVRPEQFQPLSSHRAQHLDVGQGNQDYRLRVAGG